MPSDDFPATAELLGVIIYKLFPYIILTHKLLELDKLLKLYDVQDVPLLDK